MNPEAPAQWEQPKDSGRVFQSESNNNSNNRQTPQDSRLTEQAKTVNLIEFTPNFVVL